jgi:hypothetical protein
MFHNYKELRPYLIIPMILGGIILALLMAFLLGYFVMVLWNWLMPVIFGFVKITYWQAWGLVLLSHLLFKFNPFHRGHKYYRSKHFDKECFKEKVREKFDKKADEPTE